MSWGLGTSAGEMESEWAGTPARVIRERYRRAADIAKVRGKCVPVPQARGVMVAVQEMHTTMNIMRHGSPALLKRSIQTRRIVCGNASNQGLIWVCASSAPKKI